MRDRFASPRIPSHIPARALLHVVEAEQSIEAVNKIVQDILDKANA